MVVHEGGDGTDYNASPSSNKGSSNRGGGGGGDGSSYNPKEDAIREESKTDLQELLDDINRFDNEADQNSGETYFERTGKKGKGKGSGRNGKKGGRSKRMMSPELAQRVNASDFNVFEFLREPVREEYGTYMDVQRSSKK